MKTVDEMIAVMQAYKEGKTIEYCNDTKTAVWKEISVPAWDWSCSDYRVKEEPCYVPYDSVTEIDRSKWVRKKNVSSMLMAINLVDTVKKEVYIMASRWYTLEEFFKFFEYEDGTPCGKLMQEEGDQE